MITEFQGEYRWLSNHVPCVVEYDGHKFPTVEHAYVYSKTVTPEEQEAFLIERDNMSPGEAKKIGKMLTLRPDWEQVRLGIMLDLTRQKYSYGYFRNKLLETGDQEIVEGNTWGDRFWGKYNGEGENQLGRIIMQVRDELRQKSQTD